MEVPGVPGYPTIEYTEKYGFLKMEWCPEEDSNLHTLSGTST